ncbi:hypothetical protein [Dysgonomonas sp. 511]|uniref:hypothetical protein n=1 Tax=Dysgonomonas sp. 511 TaxID=2302930 RepID=UPI0013D50D97|nr:hypothetical protein [Dysgonomonas sp. 511]NDV77608.1 hypothetical protein [Dysgonomonas sp. 511]
MKDHDKDIFKSLFEHTELDEPSASFESRLMKQVRIVSKKQKRKKLIVNILATTGGIAAAIIVTVSIFSFFDLSVNTDPDHWEQLTASIPSLHFDPLITSIGAICMLLLMGDTLIRRKIFDRKQDNNK